MKFVDTLHVFLFSKKEFLFADLSIYPCSLKSLVHSSRKLTLRLLDFISKHQVRLLIMISFTLRNSWELAACDKSTNFKARVRLTQIVSLLWDSLSTGLTFLEQFQLSVERNSGLCRFCFTTVCDWPREPAPYYRPNRCESELSCECVARVYPRLRPFAYF